MTASSAEDPLYRNGKIVVRTKKELTETALEFIRFCKGAISRIGLKQNFHHIHGGNPLNIDVERKISNYYMSCQYDINFIDSLDINTNEKDIPQLVDNYWKTRVINNDSELFSGR